jgi:hypothetical protein
MLANAAYVVPKKQAWALSGMRLASKIKTIALPTGVGGFDAKIEERR